jgi:hypothetical protein
VFFNRKTYKVEMTLHQYIYKLNKFINNFYFLNIPNVWFFISIFNISQKNTIHRREKQLSSIFLSNITFSDDKIVQYLWLPHASLEVPRSNFEKSKNFSVDICGFRFIWIIKNDLVVETHDPYQELMTSNKV